MAEAATIDAFHRGGFYLVQPQGRGHRSGVDAMLLAAAVPGSFAGRLADLGAGAGAAGLAVAARCREAHVVLVERAPEMAAFAERSLALAENAALARRAGVLIADVGLGGRARAAAGLADGSFDFVIMNPPFNQSRDRPTPDVLKQAAHVMPAGGLDAWLRTAAAIAKPRAGLALIARPAQLAEILAGLAGRFGSAAIMPILPHADRAAIRLVVRAIRGARGALTLLPPLALHERGGNLFTARAEAINNGRAALFGD